MISQMELLNYFFTGLYICSQTYAIQVKTEMLRSNKLDAGIFNFIKDPKSNMNTYALLHECNYNVPSSLVKLHASSLIHETAFCFLHFCTPLEGESLWLSSC